MIDKEKLMLQVAREISNTFMPPGLSSEQAEVEIQRIYAYLTSKEPAPDLPADAFDHKTGLLKNATILPVLDDWIRQAEEADRRKREALKESEDRS